MHEWPGQDSNLRTTDYESAALTTELPGRAGEATGACVRRTGMIPRDVDRCRPARPRPLDQLIRRDARPGVDVHRRWRDRQRVDRLRGRASDGRAPAEP